MRRKRQFLAPLSLTFSVLLFSGLGLLLWQSGGLAFSPGDLSSKSRPASRIQGFSSHADFEQECKRCHQPLKSLQASLCMDCHTEIAKGIEKGNELHGKLENPLQCAACHGDHKGREFDPLQGALAHFDHAITSFSLIWHQFNYDTSRMDCQACHLSEQDFKVQDKNCSGCHTGADQDFMVEHRREFGDGCQDCHDGTDNMVNFDHSATAFPLHGKHSAIRCVDCHLSGHFEETSGDCLACHSEPGVHEALFEADCTACHSTETWSPATLDGESFSHQLFTSFSLARHSQDFQGQAINCKTCHLENLRLVDVTACTTCHTAQDADFMTRHQNGFGSNCLDCHDGTDRMDNFDHANFFPLEGRHAEIDCEGCHLSEARERIFAGTPRECSQCHAEPEIHAGFFGLKCQYCHAASNWTPARLKIHPFPLDHGQDRESACETCHVQAYDQYTCYECHEHQEQDIIRTHTQAGVLMEALKNCFQCHPSGLVEQNDRDK